ncbi:MAG: hypothetical protein AAF418_00990 [Pseudomonadota bacterium]
MRYSTRLMLVVVAILAASCSTSNDSEFLCPEILLLGETQTITRFTAESTDRNEANILYRSALEFGAGSCAIDDEDGTVYFEFPLLLLLEQGPALPVGQQVTTEVFIVVLTGDNAVTNLERLPLSFVFQGPGRVIQLAWPVETSFQMAPGTNTNDYRIYLGFQLNNQEIKTLREQQPLIDDDPESAPDQS